MKSTTENKLDREFSRENQAKNYSLYRPIYPIEFLDLKIAPLVLKTLEKQENTTALDLTCGSGQLTISLLNYFQKVIGVDFNEKQLENAKLKNKSLIESGRLSFEKFDCSKIDELVAHFESQSIKIDFVFMAQGFHWFDYNDFLKRFKKISSQETPSLTLIGYTVPELVNESIIFEKQFNRFHDEIASHFKCNRVSLDNMHKEFDFHQFFKTVEFSKYDEFCLNVPIQNYLGYLDTISAYRNSLDHFKNDPSKDPLLNLMASLGVENYQTKDFQNIKFSSGCPKSISYKNRFFMYHMK